MAKKIIVGIILIGVVSFLALQLVPVDRSNPPVVSEPNWDSPETEAFARRACFDCHSNETNWPFYAYIAPISWRVAEHVHEGREEFNMSAWQPGEGDDAAEEVAEGEMPLWDYLLMHPEAQLTEAETERFIAGLRATFGEEEDETGSNEEIEAGEEYE